MAAIWPRQPRQHRRNLTWLACGPSGAFTSV